MLGTGSFALMLLVICLQIGDRFAGSRWLSALTATGQMTLTHYVVHLTIGMGLLWGLTGHPYTGTVNEIKPESPELMLAFTVAFYLLSVAFSVVWSARRTGRTFQHGPLETLMRNWAG